jgi:putative ABC transport system substrate-binding protein
VKWEVKALWRLMASMAVGLVALASAAGAAEPGAVRRIGALMPPSASQEDGLRQGLRDLGYIEGRNVVIEWRRWRSSSTKEELEALAADLARSGVELIVASGTPAALAAARATTTPVVFLSADPVGTGLVESLSKPGG